MYWAGTPNQGIHRRDNGECYDTTRPHPDDRVVVRGTYKPVGLDVRKKRKETMISGIASASMAVAFVLMLMISF